MDPISIITGCASLVKTITEVVRLIQDCRQVPDELKGISLEIVELKVIVEHIQEQFAAAGENASSLLQHVSSVIQNCRDVVEKIQALLEEYGGTVGSLRWVLSRRKEVASLRCSLDAHRAALSLALESITLYGRLGIRPVRWIALG